MARYKNKKRGSGRYFIVLALIIGGFAVNTYMHTNHSSVFPQAVSTAGNAASSAASANLNGTNIKSVHSPLTVSLDMNLTPGECHAKIENAADGSVLPDPKCTPGAIDPAVTQANLSSTICVSGYTKTVRASSASTGKEKVVSLSQYGMNYSHTTEYDHLISLELGGANSVSNLWPEPNKSSAAGVVNPKDKVENALNKAVCSHQVTLAAAQKAIATNWTTAESTLGIAQ